MGLKHHIALVSSLTPVPRVLKESVVLCNLSGVSGDAILTLTASQLVAMASSEPLKTVQEIIIHNATTIAAQAMITAQAFAKDVGVICTTELGRHSVNSNCSRIKLSLYLGRSDLIQLISADVAIFVRLFY